MSVLITTTVSVDAQKTGAQVTLHLVQGDAGTRRILFVPISGGRLIDTAQVSMAKVILASSALDEPLEIDCVISSGKIYMTPTAAMVEFADEFACQLVLYNSSNETLSTMPFTIIVHGTVFEGDAVEHTNTRISSVRFDDETGRLTIELADGTVLVANYWNHTHDLATALKDGFLSKEDFALLRSIDNYINQDVKTTATPRFEGLEIGWDEDLQEPILTIDNEGVITGLRFT